ncbi:glycine--tRNA ligase-like protein, partial [Dinothrombium tinctorium]
VDKLTVSVMNANESVIKPNSTRLDIFHKIDDSKGPISRRYARTDEIAIPFGITIDFDTLKNPSSVTLRERDSMEQIRSPFDEIANLVKDLLLGKIVRSDVISKYPKFEQQETNVTFELLCNLI